MIMKIFSAFIAAITVFDFIWKLAQKKLTLKKLLSFCLILAFCLLAYFMDDFRQNKHETISDTLDSSVADQPSLQTPNDNIDDLGTQPDNFSNSIESEQPVDSSDESSKEDQVEIGTPFIEVTPKNQITSANLYKWDKENDRDIIGNTYPAAIKLTVSNMIDVLFGYGESNISVDVHFPFGEKATGVWNFSFVTAQEMVGNGSSAEITILTDNEELYPTFSLTSFTTDDLTYAISLDGIRDLVLHFECTTIGNGFYAGIVLDDNVE